MDEEDGLKKRYNEAAEWALIGEPSLSDGVFWMINGKKLSLFMNWRRIRSLGLPSTLTIVKITLFRCGVEQVVLNWRSLLHMEHSEPRRILNTWKAKDNPSPQSTLQHGSKVTPKTLSRTKPFPHGQTQNPKARPTLIINTETTTLNTHRPRISISRHNLPQPRPRLLRSPKHATDLSLPSTIGPTSRYTGHFRLYNADIFGCPLDSPTSLYGSISLMHAHFATPTVAIFNAIASETWIELE